MQFDLSATQAKVYVQDSFAHDAKMVEIKIPAINIAAPNGIVNPENKEEIIHVKHYDEWNCKFYISINVLAQAEDETIKSIIFNLIDKHPKHPLFSTHQITEYLFSSLLNTSANQILKSSYSVAPEPNQTDEETFALLNERADQWAEMIAKDKAAGLLDDFNVKNGDLLVYKVPELKRPVYHPVTKKVLTIESAVIGLNDNYGWSREQVADWLDTLDYDLSLS